MTRAQKTVRSKFDLLGRDIIAMNSKYIAGLFMAVALVLPSVSMAAPTGWKPAQDCVLPKNGGSDHGIWNVDGSALTGCLTDEAVKQADADARARADAVSGLNYFFKQGESVVLKIGRVETCPWWFPMGCVIPRALILR